MKFKIWLSLRLLLNKKVLFGGSAPLSFLGLVLGVAALVTSMSVMRGFETSLKSAMIDVTGDIQIVKRGKFIESWSEFSQQVQKTDPSIKKMARFAYAEAVVASKGQVSGVLMQGLEPHAIDSVLNLKSRVIEGALSTEPSTIAIGVGLARKFALKIGDEVYLAVPLSTPFESSAFRRHAKQFKISAVIDMGKNEWNERLVLSHLKDLQELTEIGDRFTGAFLKLTDSDLAHGVTEKLTETLGLRFTVMNWFDVNRNLLEAVELEKIVIFFVVFLIVIVAAFNISSTLYVLIRQRYKDIAILKALGCPSKLIRSLFMWQGVLVATFGSLLGLVLGLILCAGFMWLQKHMSVISGAVYKIDRIDVQFSFLDFFIIYVATLITCLIATYSPAKKGSELPVVEGLRKD